MKTEDLFNEYATLAGETDSKSVARKNEILDILESRKSPELQAQASDFVDKKLDEMEEEIVTLKEQMTNDTYKLLPLAYIAREYFGKTRSWLYQRLNGYIVRGKVYTLNDEQKHIFNGALKDIAQKIGSLHLA